MKKILIVVDYQHDFASPDGLLSVPDADKLSQNIQKRIDSDYDAVIYTFDTHTKEQYQGSEEEKLFPGIHCEFGTKGWKLFEIQPKTNKFDTELDNFSEPFSMVALENEYFFTKDVFDIWSGNEIYPRWFEATFPADDVEIDVVGVATEFCVQMNILGLVERGYKVNLIQDAVTGITPDGVADAMKTFEEKGVEINGN